MGWILQNGQWVYQPDNTGGSQNDSNNNNSIQQIIGSSITGKNAANWKQNAAGQALGIDPSNVDTNSGALWNSINNAVANNPANFNSKNDTADQQRINALIQQLQGQAQTGNGAWQQQLAQSTQNAQSGAQALGQSYAQQAGLGNMAARRGIENAQTGASQKAAGLGTVLRSETQQNAQDLLGQLYAGQAAGGLNAAQAEANAQQQLYQLGVEQQAQQAQTLGGTLSGIAQGTAAFLPALLSDGGKVPGKAKKFGDDESNDTVEALLSPGEIVIPRSITQGPDAARKAAEFVAKTKAKHFDSGGYVDPGTAFGFNATNLLGPAMQDPSIQNGGTVPFGSSGYTAARGQLGNYSDQVLGPQAQGIDPVEAALVQAQQQSAQDQLLGSALGGSRSQAQMAQSIGGAGQGLEDVAGQAAGARAGRQGKMENQLSNQLIMQRQMDLAAEKVRQQAAFNNLALNAGISLNQQSIMRNLFSGAGQAFSASANSGAFSGAGPTEYGDQLNEDNFGDTISSGGDFSVPDMSGPTTAAYGGMIPAKKRQKFTKAVKSRR